MPYKPGQSGNPKGKKKGHICTISPSTLKKYKSDFIKKACDKYDTVADKIIDKAFEQALEGNEKMIIMIWDIFFDPKVFNVLPERVYSRNAKEIDASQGMIIETAGRGDISMSYAMDMIRALAIKRESIIVKELEQVVNEMKAREKS